MGLSVFVSLIVWLGLSLDFACYCGLCLRDHGGSEWMGFTCWAPLALPLLYQDNRLTLLDYSGGKDLRLTDSQNEML